MQVALWALFTGCALALPTSPSTPPYTVRGSIDVGTLENSIFSWKGELFLLENIGCSYVDHAGQWFPEFQNHSYARIRLLSSGDVVSNISSTIAYGFISPFVEPSTETLWLFGTQVDRCKGTYSNKDIFSWSSSDMIHFSSATATVSGFSTFNVEVAAVATPSPSLPPHRFVMIAESFHLLLNNADDGNLSSGWFAANSTAPAAPSGGPSIRWAEGYYYVITGGAHVMLVRSKDLVAWEGPVTMIQPTPADAHIAPFAGFPLSYARKGFQVMENHWADWDWNSNDGDVCCADPNINGSYIVYGASTQGKPPKAPVPKSTACTNAIATSELSMAQLLASFFE